MTDVVAQFAELFGGNPSAYWTEGRMAVREPVTDEVWRNHLQSGPSIGIYPLVVRPSGTPDEFGYDAYKMVAWGCTDIDLPKFGIDPSDTTMARNLKQVLFALGISAWVERSKSKGWHVWVFVDGWCPAEWMRNALLFAHQVAGVPPTEVNPKNVQAASYSHSEGCPNVERLMDPREPGLAGGVIGGRGQLPHGQDGGSDTGHGAAHDVRRGRGPSSGGDDAAERSGPSIHQGFGEGAQADVPLQRPVIAQGSGADVRHLPVDGGTASGQDQGVRGRVDEQRGLPLSSGCLAGCKQVDGVELGNLVRLPYPGGRAGVSSNARQVIMDPISLFVGGQVVMPLGEFVSAAHAGRNSASVIEAVAAMYKPPAVKRVAPVVRSTYSGGLKSITDQLAPLTWTVFKDGPTERFGHDRSRTLQRLAFLCKEDGLSPGDTLELLYDADSRWGKHAERGDADKYLPGYVQRAY